MTSDQPIPAPRIAGLPPGVATGPLGKRFVAALIDVVVPALLATLASALVQGGAGLLRLLLAAACIVLVVGWWLLVWWMFATRAAGPGMRLTGLQLVGVANGRPIGWWRFLLRSLILWALDLTGVGLLLMIIFLVLHPRRQGWHDLAVNSVVIKERRLVQPQPKRSMEVPETTSARRAALSSAPSAPSASSTSPEPRPEAPSQVAVPHSASTGTAGSTSPAGLAADGVSEQASPSPAPGPALPPYPQQPYPAGPVSAYPPPPGQPYSGPAPPPQPYPPYPPYPPQPTPMDPSQPPPGHPGAPSGPALPYPPVPGYPQPVAPSTPAPDPAGSVPPSAAAPGTQAETARAASESPGSAEQEAAASAPAGRVTDPASSEGPRGTMAAATKTPGSPASANGWLAVLDDGRQIPIAGLVLLGRNPQPRPGEEDAWLIKIADTSRTVSKSHLEMGVNADGMYILDRGSTNGSTVTNVSGVSKRCPPGEIVPVSEGSIVSFGDHWLEVRRG